MESIDEIYNKLISEGEYAKKYEWNQRNNIGKTEHSMFTTRYYVDYEGGSLDYSEYLLKKLRENGYETHIVFTKKDYKYLHAAVVYKDKNDNRYYIADPITDIKKFTEMELDRVYPWDENKSDSAKKREELINESTNKRRSIEDYIKDFGKISLYHIYSKGQPSEYITNYDELEKELIEAEKYDENGFNKFKTNRNGTYYNDEGYNYEGYNKKGFNKEGLHYKTNTQYDELGRNERGHLTYDSEGYNIIGFNKFQRHRNGTFYDDEGYDYRGKNRKGFDRSGMHYKTNEPFNENGYDKNGEYYYDEEGYDYLGYSKEGYDRNGYDKRGFNKDGIHENGTKYDYKGYDFQGYDTQGFDEEGYNKKGYNKYGVDREGINKETGKRDVRITLVEEFIQSDTSRKMFCKSKNINLDDFNKLLKEIFSIYPNISITESDIQKEAKKSSAIYLSKREKIANGLIKGELTFDEYCQNAKGIKIEDLLAEVKGTSKEIELYRIIGNGLTSKERDMMDYIRLFRIGDLKSNAYQGTMQKFTTFMKDCSKHKELLDLYKKLKGEERRLQGYKERFNKSKCSNKVGYLNKDTGEIEFIEITDKHIEYAKRHLFNTGKYVCMRSIENVFKQFAKGELTFEDIENENIQNTNLESLEIERAKLEREKGTMESIETLIERKEGNSLSQSGG